MGKAVDLGALMLSNENTRAVGNMGVNARGDLLDSANQVIDPKNRQVQRQYKKQSAPPVNTSDMLPTTSTRAAREKKKEQQTANVAKKIKKAKKESAVVEELTTEDITAEDTVEETVEDTPKPEVPRGGLAAAIAKSQAVKQELLKTPRQLAQERAGVKKI